MVLAMLCALATTAELHAQTRSNLVLMQGVIDGMETDEQWRLATQALKEREDVVMVRLCNKTHNMMLHVTMEHGLDRATINGLWEDLGMQVRCVKLVTEERPFRHLDPATCNKLPAQR